MDLQCEHAFLGRADFVLIGDIDGRQSVDEVLEMIALGDDDVIVPIMIMVSLSGRSTASGKAAFTRHQMTKAGRASRLCREFEFT